jgi:hypothetical protein
MFTFDPEPVRANVQKATTEDLLDRVTVYGAGMEPEALEIIEVELAARGVKDSDIRAHAAQRAETAVFLPDGTVVSCSFCARPAVSQAWGLQNLFWGHVPLLPRYFAYCSEHARAAAAGQRPRSIWPRYFTPGSDGVGPK